MGQGRKFLSGAQTRHPDPFAGGRARSAPGWRREGRTHRRARCGGQAPTIQPAASRSRITLVTKAAFGVPFPVVGVGASQPGLDGGVFVSQHWAGTECIAEPDLLIPPGGSGGHQVQVRQTVTAVWRHLGEEPPPRSAVQLRWDVPPVHPGPASLARRRIAACTRPEGALWAVVLGSAKRPGR